MSVKRYLPAAQNIARLIPDLLAGQGLEPSISGLFLTETKRGDVWLFIVLYEHACENPEAYTAAGVLAHLSAAFQGHPVTFSHSDGLRYAVLLNPARKLDQTSRFLDHP